MSIVKVITISLVTVVLFCSSALALEITYATKLQKNCTTSINFPIYGTDGYHLQDVLNASDRGIVSKTSGVSVYVDEDKVNIPDKWVQATNYIPSSDKYFVIWNNGLSTLNISKLKPSDRDKTVAQVVFRIRRMYDGESNTFKFDSENSDYIYSKFNDKVPEQIHLGNLKQSFDPSTLTVDIGCLNIKPMWCGDGVIDSNYEKCDYMDPSKTMWGPGGCSAECQPLTK